MPGSGARSASGSALRVGEPMVVARSLTKRFDDFVAVDQVDFEIAQGESYGDDRLSNVLCAHRDRPAQEIADAILSDVSRFQGDHDRFDDETIIVLRVR